MFSVAEPNVQEVEPAVVDRLPECQVIPSSFPDLFAIRGRC